MLRYHAGQVEVQQEANTRDVAEMLAGWVGPVGEFCRTADMLVLAAPDNDGRLAFAVLSGSAPIVEPLGPDRVALDAAELPGIDVGGGVACGALAISLAAARRARLNGVLERTHEGLVLRASEAFTNCRKYVAPSMAVASEPRLGPSRRARVDVSDPELASAVARCETAFLASVSPDGTIDVSHRGGPAGFLELAPETGTLAWDEYVGDGMLKSAGNIRATGRMSLLVLDLESGDGFEIRGRAEVAMQRRDKTPRTDPLLQHAENYPVQGRLTCHVEEAYRLADLTHPRRRLEKRQRVTSASRIEHQAPQ